MRIPRIVISGTGSGVGKTSITAGLARAFSNRGLRVQTFKTGPDFLDPTYLTLASKRPCYNLDGWMQGKEYACRLFAEKSQNADIAIVEGVMGLFDGASPDSLEGSTAEIAMLLDAPVLLAVNAHGVARTFAALVKGCADFVPGLNVAGVIANNTGSHRHASWLEASLASSSAPPLVGAIPRGALETLPSRHLGLITADARILPEEVIERLASAIEDTLHVDRIIQLARNAPEIGIIPHVVDDTQIGKKIRIGIAKDKAFHFYYPDNLEYLERAGAELVEFSPINDSSLPENLNGLYIGGGYPEEFCGELSSNTNMLHSVNDFAAGGKPVYAECGGLMYLSCGIETNCERFGMAGVLPVESRMLEKRKSLGYVEVELTEDSLWGVRGDKLRGHEFHYSELTCEPAPDDGWSRVYEMRKRNSINAVNEGYQKGNVLASYAHLHFASSPGSIQQFISKCRNLA